MQENYDYIESPRKLPWSTDIAVRFENILQTPEYVLRVENLLQNQNIGCQEDVDLMTEKLTDILVEGVKLADISKTDKVLPRAGSITFNVFGIPITFK